jgi:hypothetical protein
MLVVLVAQAAIKMLVLLAHAQYLPVRQQILLSDLLRFFRSEVVRRADADAYAAGIGWRALREGASAGKR